MSNYLNENKNGHEVAPTSDLSLKYSSNYMTD
jgi:hypothetical protein